jgi:hypothetical protein
VSDSAARRPRLPASVRYGPLLVCAGVGVGAGVAIALIGGTAGLLVGLAILVAFLAAGRSLRARFLMPVLLPKVLEACVDPAVGPPDYAVPADPEPAQRVYDTVRAGDSWAIDLLVAPDATFRSPLQRRTYDRRMYVKATRAMADAYPDLAVTVDEVRVDPDDPTCSWVRSTQGGTARGGRTFRAVGWERWRVAGDGRVCDIATLGLLAVE